MKLFNRRFQSEIYEITDCLFYDIGTTGTPNSEWWLSNTTNLILTSDNTGLTASNSTSSTYYLSPNKIGTSKSSLSDLIEWNDFVCEFTFHEFGNNDTSIYLQTRDADGQVNQKNLISGILLVDGDVVKMIYTDNTATFYKNDVVQGNSQTNCSGDIQIRFAIKSNSIRFSNFKVYQI